MQQEIFPCYSLFQCHHRYGLMSKCWEYNGEARPTFKDIHAYTSSYITRIADYLEMDDNPFCKVAHAEQSGDGPANVSAQQSGRPADIRARQDGGQAVAEARQSDGPANVSAEQSGGITDFSGTMMGDGQV